MAVIAENLLPLVRCRGIPMVWPFLQLGPFSLKVLEVSNSACFKKTSFKKTLKSMSCIFNKIVNSYFP